MNFSSTFWIKEEEKLAHTCYYIEWVERLCELFKLRECGHQFEDVVFQVLFFEITVARRVIKRNLYASLEEINFSYNVMEEGYNLDSTELISFKFEECA